MSRNTLNPALMLLATPIVTVKLQWRQPRMVFGLLFGLAAAHPAAAQVTADTLFDLPFNGSVTAAQGQNPTVNKSVSFVNGVSGASGPSGQAAAFTQSSDLEYAGAGNIDASQGTLEFFVNAPWNVSPTQGFTFLTVAGDSGMTFVKDGANNIRGIFDRFGADGNPEVGVPAVNVGTLGWKSGQWHELAYTWSNSTKIVQLYIDGSLATSASFANNLPAFRPAEDTIWVGQDAQNGTKLTGDLDELRISDTVLTAQQIQTRYNSFTASASAPEPSALALLASLGLPAIAGIIHRRRTQLG